MVKDLKIAILLSVIVTIILNCIIKFLLNKKAGKRESSRQIEEKINEYAMSFLFNDDSSNVDFFFNLAKEKHDATKKSHYVIIQNKKSKIVLYPFFSYNKFSSDDLILAFNQTKKDNPTRLIICTNEIDADAMKLKDKLQQLEIVILDKYDTYYKLLKEYDFYPKNKVDIKKDNKKSFKDFLGLALNKKRTKGYFIASLILLISSFIVRYNIYYVIMSSLLLVLALISFLNPKFNKQLPTQLFDD
ncbi:MAG: hypothetical protein RR400_03815 [Clostridia bacterium]